MYHRIMGVFNVNCLIFSVCSFCGSWPMISTYPLYGSSGNQKTCDAQGFIALFTFLTTALYYILLSIFAYISVKNNFDEASFRKYEIQIHMVIHIIPMILSVAALKKEFFNPYLTGCLISTYPPKCAFGEQFGKCTRGGDGFKKFTLVISILLMVVLVLPVVLFVVLYCTIRKKERRNSELIGKQKIREHARRYKSRIIAKQAFIYCTMFYICIFPTSFVRLWIRFSNGDVSFGWLVLGVICPSSIGITNLIVYQRLLKRQPAPHEVFILAPLAERVSMSRLSLTRNTENVNLLQCNPCNFSIFDGTNPSDSDIGQFVDEWSYKEDDKPEGLNDEAKESDIA